jgi:hypothetical protein
MLMKITHLVVRVTVPNEKKAIAAVNALHEEGVIIEKVEAYSAHVKVAEHGPSEFLYGVWETNDQG